MFTGESEQIPRERSRSSLFLRERAAAFANSCTVKNVAEAPFLVSTLKPTVEMVLYHGAVIAIIRFRTQPLTTILH